MESNIAVAQTLTEQAGTELIIVRQLPIIEEQLKSIKAQIQGRIDNALALECTEGSVKFVKAERADLNNLFKSFEEKRKGVKKTVLAPYEKFEETYKECVTNIFSDADKKMKEKIDGVEGTIKAQRSAEVEEFYCRYATALEIDFIPFSRSGISVGLTGSIMSYEDRVKEFLDRIAGELAMISTQENYEEILVEYKQTLNASSAIMTVTNRHKAIEQERRKAEPEKVEAPARPEPKAKVKTKDDTVYSTTFTVYGTVDELAAVKKFLDEGGYEYGY